MIQEGNLYPVNRCKNSVLFQDYHLFLYHVLTAYLSDVVNCDSHPIHFILYICSYSWWSSIPWSTYQLQGKLEIDLQILSVQSTNRFSYSAAFELNHQSLSYSKFVPTNSLQAEEASKTNWVHSFSILQYLYESTTNTWEGVQKMHWQGVSNVLLHDCTIWRTAQRNLCW